MENKENQEIKNEKPKAAVGKAKSSIFKKWWLWAIIAAVVIIIIASSGGGETDNLDQGSGAASGSGISSTTLGDYDIVISSCRLAEDYEGDPIVIVKYSFTNNSDESVAFFVALDATVYQDGIGLNECYVADDSANYSADNQTKEIKTGATIDVEVAYELNDATTDIEVEVKELFSLNDRMITKTFSIAD